MNFTSGKLFLDTNFLVYCFSKDETEKRERCRSILRLGQDAVFVVSTQVIKEFTAVMLRKLEADPREVKRAVAVLSRFEVISIDTEMIQRALDVHIIYRYSFWDSLIITAAQSGHCATLLSEDMHDEHQLLGLEIVNPFR